MAMRLAYISLLVAYGWMKKTMSTQLHYLRLCGGGQVALFYYITVVVSTSPLLWFSRLPQKLPPLLRLGVSSNGWNHVRCPKATLACWHHQYNSSCDNHCCSSFRHRRH